jgi:hypothetical protein
MKKVLLMLFLATFVASSCAVAQNTSNAETKKEEKEKKPSKIGSFIKKAGEQATGLNLTDEPFIVNPNSMDFDAEFVGAYGNSGTGNVTIIFKVKNKTSAASAAFGGSTGGKGNTTAFDTKGKTYSAYSGDSKRYDTAKGIWTEVTLDGKYSFEKVPSDLKAFELINMSFYFDAKVRGILEFRNIPIQWDVVPE